MYSTMDWDMKKYWNYKVECDEGGYWIAGGSPKDLPPSWSKNDIQSAVLVSLDEKSQWFFSKQSGVMVLIIDDKNHTYHLDDIAIKSVKSVYDPLSECSRYETEIIGVHGLP